MGVDGDQYDNVSSFDMNSYNIISINSYNISINIFVILIYIQYYSVNMYGNSFYGNIGKFWYIIFLDNVNILQYSNIYVFGNIIIIVFIVFDWIINKYFVILFVYIKFYLYL